MINFVHLLYIGCTFFCVYKIYRIVLPTKKICLKDRVALITGAGSGIGRELALSLAQLGVHLILLDIRKDAIDAVSAEIIQRQETEEKDPVTAVINKEAGLRNRQPSASAPRSTSTSTRAGVTVKVLTYECDISLPDMIDRTNELIANDLQRLNLPPVSLLINNAGIVIGSSLWEKTNAQIKRTVDVNLLSHFYLIKAYLPHMLGSNDGCIVTVSSLMGTMGSAGLSDYCSSKWGLMGMHESLRLDLRRHWARSARENKNTGEVGEVGSGDSDSDGTNGGWGVHTLLVCPYATDTGMFKGIFNEESSSASSPSSLSSPSTTSSLVSPWRCVCSVLCLHARAVLIAVMKSVRGVCFPLLRPRQVSDRIIYAIVNKETEVVIPGGILTIAPLLLRFLPLWLRDLALEGFGGVDGMDSFKGRGKEWSKVDYDPM